MQCWSHRSLEDKCRRAEENIAEIRINVAGCFIQARTCTQAASEIPPGTMTIHRQCFRPLLSLACMLLIWLQAVSSFDFRITGEGGFFQYITDGDGNQIGARFLNPIYDKEGNRIGTNQGYTYYFPPDTGFTVDAIEKAQSAYAAASFPTRTFYFKDGTITFVNEAIVAASGRYEQYYSPSGGTIREVITSNDPYEAKVWLLEPDDTSSSATIGSGLNLIACIAVSTMLLMTGHL